MRQLEKKHKDSGSRQEAVLLEYSWGRDNEDFEGLFYEVVGQGSIQRWEGAIKDARIVGQMLCTQPFHSFYLFVNLWNEWKEQARNEGMWEEEVNHGDTRISLMDRV